MFADMPYYADLSEEYVSCLLDKLNHRSVILTGVGFREGETGVMLQQGNSRSHYSHPRIGKSYHGTGDMFAAAFTGALMQEKTMHEAVEIAADFVCRCIENTAANPAHWYGVKFETALPELIRRISE